MTAVCSWCSAEVPEGATNCPSCGANLVPDGDPNVPGVTAVDAASIIRSKTAPQPRSRLLSWISGEYVPETPSQSEAQAIAPPDLEVRREIFRLELEAEVANLQAEADALRAEAAAEGRTVPEFEALDGAPGDSAEPAEGSAAAGDAPPETPAGEPAEGTDAPGATDAEATASEDEAAR